jgi:hypothetical protein
VALQFFDDPDQAGKSLDSTPSDYDTTFYKETKEGTAPYSLQSDRLLSNDSQVCSDLSLSILTVSLTFIDGRYLVKFR